MTTPDRAVEPFVSRRGGLTGALWRLALVIGVAQFSMSVWTWQFGILIETIVEPWQMGLTFTAGSLANLLGIPLSGYISDFIGRRKTLMIAYLPMAVGLFSMFSFPVWPLFPFFYALIQFGWAFVLMMARAAPADQVSQDGGKNSGRTFTMILLPAFAMDGLSPLLASFLLLSGLPQQGLLVLGGTGTLFAFIASAIFVRETLSSSIQKKARSGPVITLRGLGSDFWVLAGGLVGIYMTFGLTFPYLGNLVVEEWHVSTSTWGIIWSMSSLTIATLSFFGGKIADRNLKISLLFAVPFTALIILGHALLEGVFVLLFINLLWGFGIVIWIAAERSLIVQGVSEEKQGRALSTFQAVMSTFQIMMMNVGAYIWTVSGNLRVLFFIAGVIALVSFIPLAIALRHISLREREQSLATSQDLWE